MDISVREEILILSLIFCFCVLTIPVILMSASAHHKGDKNQHRTYAELTMKERALIESINILEDLNKRSNVSSAAFSDILNETDEKVFKTYENSLRQNVTFKASKKQIRNVWSKFNLVNGTILKSPSLRLPLKVDWREKSVITKVKNQKNCGSCFAVGVVETIESMLALNAGKLMELSVQQMLDCNDEKMGCDGGDPCRLLNWLHSTQTNVQLNENYPSGKDQSKKQECDIKSTKVSGTKVKDYSCNDFVNHEELILLYLAHQGPLVACINSLPVQSYKRGIVEHECDSNPLKSRLKTNHVVQIVGYDMTGKVPFYIVKNSWGQNHGLSGYLNIAIGRNICGIAQEVSAIIV